MTGQQHLQAAQQLLALAGDRELIDERRAAQVAEAQARAVVGILAVLLDVDAQQLAHAVAENVEAAPDA